MVRRTFFTFINGLSRVVCFTINMLLFRSPILKVVFKALDSKEPITKREDACLEELSKSGYEVAYSKLFYASKPEYDPLQGIYYLC